VQIAGFLLLLQERDFNSNFDFSIPNKMTDLQRYFEQNRNREINKWTHYFDVYEKHFSRYRNKEVIILEVGVFQGGSLQLWKSYFGPLAKIYGVDINPECKNLEEDNITIFIGSQSDRQFLKSIKSKIPPIDILIDDGGHTMLQQIITFEELFSHIKSDGVFLCEDLHTSYWIEYGGGHKRQGTFIEYSKNFIDLLNAYHSEQKSLQPNNFTSSVDSLHFYDSILIIEKRKRTAPQQVSSGKKSFADEAYKEIRKSGVWQLKYKILHSLNTMLRFFRMPGYKWR